MPGARLWRGERCFDLPDGLQESSQGKECLIDVLVFFPLHQFAGEPREIGLAHILDLAR